MKALGVVRRIDRLGRIAIPASLRRLLRLEENTSVEIFVDGDCMVLKKYIPSCSFCEGNEDIKLYQGKNVCINCITAMFTNASAV